MKGCPGNVLISQRLFIGHKEHGVPDMLDILGVSLKESAL
jgi:hypothetical protein